MKYTHVLKRALGCVALRCVAHAICRDAVIIGPLACRAVNASAVNVDGQSLASQAML